MFFFCSEPYLITLYGDVRISCDEKFITPDGGSWVFRREAAFRGVVRFARISIGNNSFIGSSAIILPGVHIGNDCVVAAGAIVTSDVPDGSLVAGIPARVLSSTIEYARKMKTRLPENWDMKMFKKNKKQYLLDVLHK